VYYLDEWLERIAKGQVRPSSTDEVKQKQKDTSQKLVDAAEKMVYDIADKRTTEDAVPMTTLMEQALAEAEQVQAAHAGGGPRNGRRLRHGGGPRERRARR
jgi:hypothetical protein